MQLGLIGLGRMGANMTRRLLQGGHQVVVYDTSAEAIQAAVIEGASGASSLEEVVARLTPPRWPRVVRTIPADDSRDIIFAKKGGGIC
jgi:6-phosphogluconate dehydrogenase